MTQSYNEYYRNYWKTHPEQYEKQKERTKKYSKINYNITKQNKQLKARKIKIEVLCHYSKTEIPQCSNPFGEHDKPYITLEALSIDHIDNNGANHRKQNKINCGTSTYLWLKRNNFPEGFQVLCMNCQWIKKIRNMNYII